MNPNPHILFVDDEQQFSAMTVEYLEAKGFKVTLKHSADDGLAIFKSSQFDCCIFDVKMPIKDGFSLARRCQRIGRKYSYHFFDRPNTKGRSDQRPDHRGRRLYYQTFQHGGAFS